MKHRILCLLLTLCTVCLLVGGMCAASEPQLPGITDAAGILTEEQAQRLELEAQSITAQYGVGVYIVTVDDYRDLNSADVYDAARSVYHEYTLGEGGQRNGILLLLSMAERDYALFHYGEEAAYAFNDYAVTLLEDSFLPCFSNDDWCGGFEAYLNECTFCLKQAAAGEPVSGSSATLIIILSGVSLLIAAIVCAVLVGQMKTVHKKTTAATYAVGGLILTSQFDQFTHRTETRRKIERSSSSGSGNSGGSSGKF